MKLIQLKVQTFYTFRPWYRLNPILEECTRVASYLLNTELHKGIHSFYLMQITNLIRLMSVIMLICFNTYEFDVFFIIFYRHGKTRPAVTP